LHMGQARISISSFFTLLASLADSTVP